MPPLSAAEAAPFAFERMGVRTEGSGPDLVLIPGLNSSPRAYAPVKSLTLKRIPDSAHFIMWDQPQRFQADVKTFLAAP